MSFMRLQVISTLLAVINFINKQTKNHNDGSLDHVRRREQKRTVIRFCFLFAAGEKLYSYCKKKKQKKIVLCDKCV